MESLKLVIAQFASEEPKNNSVDLLELGMEPPLNIFQPPLIILQIVPWLLPLLTAVLVLTWCCSLNFRFFTIKWSSPISLHCFISHLFSSKTLFFPSQKERARLCLNTNPIPGSVLTFVHRDVLSSLFYCALLFFSSSSFKSSSVESLDVSRRVSFDTTREIA